MTMSTTDIEHVHVTPADGARPESAQQNVDERDQILVRKGCVDRKVQLVTNWVRSPGQTSASG